MKNATDLTLQQLKATYPCVADAAKLVAGCPSQVGERVEIQSTGQDSNSVKILFKNDSIVVSSHHWQFLVFHSILHPSR